MKGYHKGVLAGLSGKEREDAINAELNRNAPKELRKSVAKLLKSRAIKGSVTSDLEKLLYKEPKEYLKRWAMVLGAEVAGRGTKADLVKAIAPKVRNNSFPVEIVLRGGLDLNQFDAYRKLYEAGGELEIREDKIKTLRGIPAPESIICYSFYTKETSEKSGKFTFVIPDDILDILAEIDWEDIRNQISSFEAAGDIADAIAELRGMAKIDEIYSEFCRFHPVALSRQEFDEAVAGAVNSERIGCVWLESDDGEDYLLHYELADYCHEKAGEDETLGSDAVLGDGDDAFGYGDSFMQGSFKVLEYIDTERRSKKPRPLEKDMISSEAVFDWKSKRPAVLALRTYLDEHVPDSQNDYFYADAVIEDLIEYMKSGFMTGGEMVEDWLSILESHDYMPGDAELRHVMGLLMNAYNSLPTWLNNGWAPDELADAMLGRKTFYNEDGSKMKIGRNDPCPCGSGKKYKNCCG